MVVGEEGPCTCTHTPTHTDGNTNAFIVFTHTVHLHAATFLWFQFLRGTFGPEKISHPKNLSVSLLDTNTQIPSAIHRHIPKGLGLGKNSLITHSSPKLLAILLKFINIFTALKCGDNTQWVR